MFFIFSFVYHFVISFSGIVNYFKTLATHGISSLTHSETKNSIVKTKGERVAGHTEKSELQWLYSKAITPFWDLQLFHFTHYLSYNRVVFHTTCK
jgi:hypothetical protein